MRLLILGAGGFIGSHLTRALLKTSDHQVTAIDTDFDKLEYHLQGQDFAKLDCKTIDIRKDDNVLRELIRQSDVVIDLIAHANPVKYVENPLEVVQLNFFDNWKIAGMAKDAGSFLLQFSSCEVYGLATGNIFPFSEETSRCVVGPIHEERWIYSCAKQLLERMIFALQREGLRFCIIRPFNFIGPGMDYLPEDLSTAGPRVVPHFIACLLRNEPLPLVDGGLNSRSYTFIEDAVDGITRIIDDLDGAFLNRVVNIGHPGNETTIADLAQMLISIYEEETGSKFQAGVLEVSGEEYYGAGYADCDRRIPDTSQLSSVGWRPKYDLETAMRSTLIPYTREPFSSELRRLTDHSIKNAVAVNQ